MDISVYITSYNQKEYLQEAIESVLAQTLPPDEILVLDDCSQDGSQDLIRSYAETYPDLIRPFFHNQNMGIAANRRFAIERVRGDWVTYLDGDDRFLPQKLELEVEALRKHPEARIAYSNFYFIDEAGARVRKWVDEKANMPAGDVFCEVFGRAFPFNTVFRNELVARECMLRVDPYDEQLPLLEDWDFKIRLTRFYEATYIRQPTMERRISRKGLSTTTTYPKQWEVHAAIVRKNWPLLQGLPSAKQARIKSELSRAMAYSRRRAAREAVMQHSRWQGWNYFLEACREDPASWMDIKTLLSLCFPLSLYQRIQDDYHLRQVKYHS